MYVVTGGGSGIGRALVLALVQKKQSCLIVGRNERNLKEVAATSPLIHYVVADLTEPASLTRLESFLADKPLKGLVHNAGTIEPLERIERVSTEAWEKLVQLNLFAPFRLTKNLLHALKGGRILHIGSGAAYFPMEGWSAYCVSKAGLSMLTRCLQLEIQDPAISCVMPGITDTNMTALIRGAEGMSAEQLDFHKRLHRENRLLSPETVAQFLCWLLLDLDADTFRSKEWDIYDETHHGDWLRAPYEVPKW
jgi:benzil reductase ((S)-benzoin forming)